MAKTKKYGPLTKDQAAKKAAGKAKAKPVIMASVKMPAIVNTPKVVKEPPAKAVGTVCGITDPFCYHAKGASWPDGTGQAAMPAYVRGHTPLTPTAAGGILSFYTPAISYCSLDTVAAGANFTTGTTYGATPGGGVVNTYAQSYRVVSAGIVIRNVAPALTTQGYVIVNRLAEFPNGALAITAGNVYGSDTRTYPMKAGLEIPIIFRPLGSSSRAFKAINSTNTVKPDADYDIISVELVGGPASGVALDIEWFICCEFTLTQVYNNLNQFIPTSAPSHPLFRTVADKVSEEMSAVAVEGMEAFSSLARAKIKQALMRGGSSLFMG